MKVQYLLLFFLLFGVVGCHVSERALEKVRPWDETLSAESDIALNAVALKNDDDFSFFRDIVKDKQVVMLGEAGHADLTTTAVKAKLVETLRQWGFRTLTLEVIPMLSGYAWNNDNFNDITDAWDVRLLLSSPWILQDNFGPMEEMIHQKQIKLFGMDTYIQETDFGIAQRIINTHSESCKFHFDWVRAKLLFRKFLMLYYQDTEFPVVEQCEYMELMNDIRYQVDSLIRSDGSSVQLKAVQQWLRNADQNYVAMSTQIGRATPQGICC